MNIVRKLCIAALTGLLSLAALAQETAPAPLLPPIPATDVVAEDHLYLQRLVVVFADSPNDPAFIRQLELLTVNPGDLIDRDVILVTDSAPTPPSALRLKLRPRGFSLVIIDKDGKVAIRKPLPWDTREISRAIDKFPSRRDEVLERNPAGR